MSAEPELVMIHAVVYARPRDLPAPFVVRRTFIYGGGEMRGEGIAYPFDDITRARAFIAHCWPNLDARIPRSPGDDPVIVETWI